ncbi:hypothetical protein F9L07_28495 [Pimelobacter simplex]|uniref:Uncharacterized protein n=1 Tax=Nocardioides simplex TaxID=2045 RepID=A0A7J5DQM4_NOCSI|nr:hypothetical protein [Pimelobacter simplex]KAB2806975.1 hypothetical protein F9L07_28495 [Pimelobacter simplex]
MTASTDLDDTLANIRARAEAATDGPWFVEPCGDFGAKTALIPDVLRERYGVNSLSCGEDFATAEFIAHARTDVPRLLDLLDEARAEAEQWRQAAVTFSDDYHAEVNKRIDAESALNGADTTTTDGSEA